MSVPSIEFTDTGLTLPSDSEILAGVQSAMNAAFGGGLNPALSTPQGQLATSEAAIISAKNAEFARFVGLIDPDTSSGFMQDAIARIYFINRRPAAPTTVAVKCVGLAGVSIPVGALVRDSSGNVYACTQLGAIAASGFVVLPFSAVVAGPVPCPIGAISGAPYRAIIGWESATNESAGVIGAKVETRAEFEFRRKASVALNAHGTTEAIYANVFDVDGVVDVYVLDNTSNATVTFGETNYPMLPHSIYVAVVGGLAADIARAIWTRKDAGSDYNGNTIVNVTDESALSNPKPSYAVKFQTPTPTPIKFAVQLANDALLPTNITAIVQDAIIQAFAGADNGPRARIGSTIFASRFYAAVAAAAPRISILSILIGTSSPTLTVLTMGIDQAPTVSASDIAVTLV